MTQCGRCKKEVVGGVTENIYGDYGSRIVRSVTYCRTCFIKERSEDAGAILGFSTVLLAIALMSNYLRELDVGNSAYESMTIIVPAIFVGSLLMILCNRDRLQFCFKNFKIGWATFVKRALEVCAVCLGVFFFILLFV